MSAKVKILKRPPMDTAERLYLKEVLRGMVTTHRHFWRNWIRRKDTVTLSYPEEKRPYSPRWRGMHRLMTRQDGSVRCVACMLCATHCPARCITIEAAEHEDPAIEKVPVRFTIDLLKCIYCGFCQEACPCDAIRLDTGSHVAPVTARAAAVVELDELLSRGGPSNAHQGGKSI